MAERKASSISLPEKCDLFAPYSGFLDATLHWEKHLGQPDDYPAWLVKSMAPDGHQIRGFQCFHPAQGVLILHPVNFGSTQLLLSCGIHGNETGPIELIDRLLNYALLYPDAVRIPICIILGNPKAMLRQERFTETNLNRMFSANSTTTQQYESCRAKELQKITKHFLSSGEKRLHFDCHTAIRSSNYEQFAVYPTSQPGCLPGEQRDFLQESGIEAALIQNNTGSTFSAYTQRQCQAQSFTLELGRVAPFGQNDLKNYQLLTDALLQLINNQADSTVHVQNPAAKPLQVFTVVHEIINTGDGFQLMLDEDAPNFTPFSKGALVWRDQTTEYRVKSDMEYIVFPNSKVGKGQRAGLIVGIRQ
ncbi:MAG: succinylglutamate desuccinylase [Pseudomonadales bacterium]|nr:succinylglutamate desuccinylase [Pseudomonadales bacterium]